MEIRYSKNKTDEFIYDIQRIDREVYGEEECTSFETDSARFKKNTDSYILLYEGEEIVGYMCIFPIIKKLYKNMLELDVAFDDNITPEDIGPYEDEVSLFIHSIAVLPKYRNGEAIVMITNAFYKFIEDKNKSGKCFIKRVVALAVSDSGRKALSRMGLEKYKTVENKYDLFILNIQPK